MDRLISEQAVIDIIHDYLEPGTHLEKRLRAIPSAEPKTGHWIDVDGLWFKCSECDAHRKMFSRYKEYFCPNCGCRMEEGDTE